MSLLFCFFLLSGSDAGNTSTLQAITLEDMSTAWVISTATHGHRTLVTAMTKMPYSDFYLYDHQTNQCWEMKDRRIRRLGVYTTVDTKKGFALLASITNRVYHLDDQARFVSAEAVADYHSVPTNIKLAYAFPFGQSQVLITYHDLEKRVRGLAVMDVDEKRFSSLHTQPLEADSDGQYWVPVGEKLFLVDGDTMALHEVAWDTFKKKRMLHEALPYIKTARVTNVKYESYLTNTVRKADGVLWERFHFKGQHAMDERDLMLLDGKRFRKLDPKVFAIGEAAGKRLVFNMDDGDFLVEAVKP